MADFMSHRDLKVLNTRFWESLAYQSNLSYTMVFILLFFFFFVHLSVMNRAKSLPPLVSVSLS